MADLEVRKGRISDGDDGHPQPRWGFVVDDVALEVKGLYGLNPHPWDDCFIEVTINGVTRRLDLPSGTERTTVNFPPNRRGPATLDPERVGKWIIPYDYAVAHRDFGRPQRSSPVILSVTQSSSGTNGTTHNVSIPATDAGDLLVSLTNFTAGGTSSTTPTDWSEPANNDVLKSGDLRGVIYCDESAGAGAGTVNHPTVGNSAFMSQVYRFEAGSHNGVTGVYCAGTSGESTTPNPPNLAPGVGSLDFAMIAWCGLANDGEISAGPTSYTDLTVDDLNATIDMAIGSARRIATVSSEDPATFTFDDTENWVAFTVMIEPAEEGGTPATVTPAAIAVAITVPTPTPTGAAAVAPAAIAVPVTLPTPSIQAASEVEPAAIEVPITLPTPVAGVSAVVTPSAIEVPITLPTASVLAASVVEPGAIDVVLELPTPTAGVQAIVNPEAIPVALEVPGPVALGAALVTPGAIAVPITVPTPTPSVEALVAPAAIVAAITVPSPSIVTPAVVSPAAIHVAIAVPTPTLFAGALAILARTFGQFHRLAGALHISRVQRGGRRGFRLDEGWERVSDIFIFDDDTTQPGTHDQAMHAVAAAWAAHAGSDQATLKAAIHAALDAYGFRRPDGSRLI